ncbi:riboflavin kinase [Thecaphora frezii]
MSAPPTASRSPVPPSARPEVCGPHAPERPYPIYLRGEVEKGFGRGSKDLGCPTANLPSRVVGPGSKLTRTGVYFGFARVLPQDEDDALLTDSEADDPASSSGNGTASMSLAEEEEDNEVVLGASPIQDSADGFPQSAQAKSKQSTRNSTQSLSTPPDARAKDAARGVDKEAEVSVKELHDASASVATAPLPTSSAAASSSSSTKMPTSPASKHVAMGSGTGSGFSTTSRRQKKKRVHLHPEDSQVFPMVMSVGWNPFYKNTYKTAEVHILHDFASDFYGLEIRVVVLGYVRPEYNYDSMDALIADIEMDKKVTINSLNRPLYQDYAQDPFLGKFSA